ncbi:YbbR-like domain-containing protein [Bacillus sp. HMF5848]|uniref:CdaR family protein n=1 Tax=Bacillus sp. HMF5848 TaxID=2495421 RepID=UPI000F7A26B4|nr:CdaR family protein [Bacillus sp. HMF5848]RSK25595.1 YbbR-like domain-containing protein [Bacillus sp. HMF5848]
MDKFMNSHWIMKIVALLLALMLYTTVNIELKNSKDTAEFPTTSSDLVTVADVPVQVFYDQENLVVSGIPPNVKVTLKGPKSIITQEAVQKDFTVLADLTDLALGTHIVELSYRDISDKITVDVIPAEVTVTIQEKVTREMNVAIEQVNADKIKDGYTTDEAIVKPSSVTITGAKEEVDSISYVRANVNLEGVAATFEQEAIVKAYDVAGNVLNVTIEPNVVDVTVPVISPNKLIPLSVEQAGEVAEGYTILQLQPVISEIRIFGPQNALERIQDLVVEVDVSQVNEDTTVDIPVELPNGVEKLEPETIQVFIDVEEEVEKTFLALPIKVIGLPEGAAIDFLNPNNGFMDITFTGAISIVEGVSSTDFELYINVEDLNAGENEVKVEVNSPPNVSWELPQDTVIVEITP